jgi:hypothetical protein
VFISREFAGSVVGGLRTEKAGLGCKELYVLAYESFSELMERIPSGATKLQHVRPLDSVETV